jgi:hypothetical protein
LGPIPNPQSPIPNPQKGSYKNLIYKNNRKIFTLKYQIYINYFFNYIDKSTSNPNLIHSLNCLL